MKKHEAQKWLWGAHLCRRELLEETVFQTITRRLSGNTKLSFLTPHPVKETRVAP